MHLSASRLEIFRRRPWPDDFEGLAPVQVESTSCSGQSRAEVNFALTWMDDAHAAGNSSGLHYGLSFKSPFKAASTSLEKRGTKTVFRGTKAENCFVTINGIHIFWAKVRKIYRLKFSGAKTVHTAGLFTFSELSDFSAQLPDYRCQFILSSWTRA